MLTCQLHVAEFAAQAATQLIMTTLWPELFMQPGIKQDTAHAQGFEAVLSSKDAMRKRPRNFKLDDRLFSLSSCTSPAVCCSALDMHGLAKSP